MATEARDCQCLFTEKTYKTTKTDITKTYEAYMHKCCVQKIKSGNKMRKRTRFLLYGISHVDCILYQLTN